MQLHGIFENRDRRLLKNINTVGLISDSNNISAQFRWIALRAC
jgi:hypothetical protein